MAGVPFDGLMGDLGAPPEASSWRTRMAKAAANVAIANTPSKGSIAPFPGAILPSQP